MKIKLLLFTSLYLLLSCTEQKNYEISGELMQWHNVTLTFDGPVLDENSVENPFLDYRLEVTFKNGNSNYTVPGYFAADGKAAQTSATKGNKWRVHFSPDHVGKWDFMATFRKGKNIAVETGSDVGEAVAFDGTMGSFEIEESNKTGRDFRSKGKIQLSPNGKFFQFASGDYFLKAGTDSPENFLAYHEFDSTYRHSAKARSGEADPTKNLHQFAPHVKDWKTGDPLWQDQKGKGIIGALNYLASTGMNAIYCLTMNIEGDGKDVWPYTHHEERLRFDCSKLDQWEIVFAHADQLGILLHLVLQETENELLLDKGNTALERKLYLRELIARYGHHNGLVWNLGEENGPADFSPNGQNTAQRKAMTTYIKQSDPYQHPVVLHTHAWKGHKDEILTKMLGFETLDGLSFQVDKRAQVHQEILKWHRLADSSDHSWLIAMDEIGMWHTGVMDDASNPDHDTIRQQVLWGSLMAGASGVEWYFGARYPHNDLTCEDWRSRENMWQQTQIAKAFFEQYLPYWDMKNSNELVNIENAYCLSNQQGLYVLYFPMNTQNDRKLYLESENNYQVRWYNPRVGGKLEIGEVESLKGKGWQDIGTPKTEKDQDWVALVTTE